MNACRVWAKLGWVWTEIHSSNLNFNMHRNMHICGYDLAVYSLRANMWFTSNIFGVDIYSSMTCVQLMLFIDCQPNGVFSKQNCPKRKTINFKCLSDLTVTEEPQSRAGSNSGTSVDFRWFFKKHIKVFYLYPLSAAWTPSVLSSTKSKQVLLSRSNKPLKVNHSARVQRRKRGALGREVDDCFKEKSEKVTT